MYASDDSKHHWRKSLPLAMNVNRRRNENNTMPDKLCEEKQREKKQKKGSAYALGEAKKQRGMKKSGEGKEEYINEESWECKERKVEVTTGERCML